MNIMLVRYLVFMAVLAAILGIMSAPIGGYNQQSIAFSNNQAQINQVNQYIHNNQTGNTVIGSSNQVSTGNNESAPIEQCNASGFLGSLYCTLVNLNNQISSSSCSFQTSIGIGQLCSTTSPSGQFQSFGQHLVGQTVGAQFYTTNNNPVPNILASPVTQALTILIAFEALGLLAGTLGAGILANVISRGAIALSVFYYFNASFAPYGVSVFNPPSPSDISFFVFVIVQAIITVPSVVLLYESLGAPSSGNSG